MRLSTVLVEFIRSSSRMNVTRTFSRMSIHVSPCPIHLGMCDACMEKRAAQRKTQTSEAQLTHKSTWEIKVKYCGICKLWNLTRIATHFGQWEDSKEFIGVCADCRMSGFPCIGTIDEFEKYTYIIVAVDNQHEREWIHTNTSNMHDIFWNARDAQTRMAFANIIVRRSDGMDFDLDGNVIEYYADVWTDDFADMSFCY